ncbi:MAG: hypothetical protein E6K34_17835 [Gammaproteobacteria bacterium]|nr:MAG: hypothetical protein E6K34_17835 [Gammaproteobacteria bacterium]
MTAQCGDRVVQFSKYLGASRLAYIANQHCVLRFDNEAGKGDHEHVGERQVPSGSPMWIRCSRIFGRK